MRGTLRLFVVTGEAAIIVAVGIFALCMMAVTPYWTPHPQTIGQKITLVAVFLIPIGVATWWMARKLRGQYSPREARAVVTSFAITSPLTIAMAMPLALFPGSYAANLWRPLGPVGQLAGVAVVITLVGFVINMLVLWFTRLIVRVEMRQAIKQSY
jgi:hypothetical protein